MIESAASTKLHYSGLETDQFVRLVMLATARDVVLDVEVRGREPITSTPAVIVGQAVSASDDGYARTLRVKTNHGTSFNIGGTNTTKSIASESVVFVNVPRTVVADVADETSVSYWLEQIREPGEEIAIKSLNALVYGVRAGALTESHRDVLVATGLKCASSDMESVRAAALRLLGLVGGDAALPVLVAALQDSSTLVRREAALRLRSMDSVVASDRDSSEAQACIATLGRVILEDPDADVRTYAAEDLGYFYDVAAIHALHTVARTDPQLDVRWAAAVAIGRTNDVNAVTALREVLSRESDASIRRAAFLGIGRQGPDLVRRSRSDAADVARAIGEAISEGPMPGVDYALYALGELGGESASYVDIVIRSMQTDDIQVLATAIMTLIKMLPTCDSEALRPTICAIIAERIHTPEPSTWPEVGFYRAFLNSAGELAMSLEEFSLAGATFTIASKTTEQAEWLKDFYEGAALYAQAEAGIAAGAHMEIARDSLQGALDAFRRVEASEIFADTDPARSGLSLKQTLAEARLAVLSALMEWRPHGVDHADIGRVRRHLARATEQYRHLDLTGMSPTERRLSGQEVSLVVCLQLIVDVLDETCHLGDAVINHEPGAVTYALSQVKARCRQFAQRADETQSASLTQVAAELSALSGFVDGRDDADAASQLLERIPEILHMPAPAPGTCPIVTFGEASIDLVVADAAGGDGTRGQPYLVSSDRELILLGTVYVRHRTKDDELIFEARTGTAEASEYVPVREGSYELRPANLGSLVPSSAPLPIEVTLSFRNRGCLQPVSVDELWVRCVRDTASAGPPPDDALLNVEIADLEARIVEIDKIVGEHPGRSDQKLASRRRALVQALQSRRDAVRQSNPRVDGE